MSDKKLGKIERVFLGAGGYQDCSFGITFDLGCVVDFWPMMPSSVEVWRKLFKDAKVTELSKLKNVPVEITFDGNVLKTWRILTEVL